MSKELLNQIADHNEALRAMSNKIKMINMDLEDGVARAKAAVDELETMIKDSILR